MSETTSPQLGILRRIVQASPGRRSRMHTMRSELVPLGAIAELPVLVVARLLHRTPEGPWFCTPAVDFLARILQPHWRVLECGSGRSTLWYARHARSVLALENEPTWHTEVTGMLSGCANAALELLPCGEFPARLSAERPESFDLVVVDGNEIDERGERLPPEADQRPASLRRCRSWRP